MKAKQYILRMVMANLVFFLIGVPAMAGEGCSRDDVVDAVEKAVGILEAHGAEGLHEVGNIRFCGDNYVFVNDLKGKTLMHAKKTLIGKVLIGLKDDKGKRFFADFSEVAKSSRQDRNGTSFFNGSGWVEYRWPKPGAKKFSPKLSFIKGCMMGDDNVYVGAGIYK